LADQSISNLSARDSSAIRILARSGFVAPLEQQSGRGKQADKHTDFRNPLPQVDIARS
jgi:hypothetical protein